MGAGALTVALAVLAGCATEERRAVPDDPVLAQGQRLYDRHCAVCHTRSGVGGNQGAPLSARIAGVYPDIEDQIRVTAEGTDTMPPFDDVLSDDELVAVTRYTREAL